MLVNNLSGLFSKFVLLNQKYTEPSQVLKALVDDFGQPMMFGEQKDIGEFNLNFLERIEEGLQERKLAKQMVQEDLKGDLDKLLGDTNSTNLTTDMVRKSSMIDDNSDTSSQNEKENSKEEA